MKEVQNHIPGGHLIESHDPQPEVRKNAETASDWEYAEEAAYLYRIASVFKDRFLDPILLTDRKRLPDPVISFDNLRNQNTLAAYTLARNPQGLLFEITMNTQHYQEADVDGKKSQHWVFGRWAQLETLLHEQVHLWQQNFGDDPVKPGKSHHNKEFVAKCENIGLHPMPGVGCHIKLADGPFAILMKELGIKPPDLSHIPDELDFDWFLWFLEKEGKRRKGKSTLNKWTCPECGLNARIGIKGNPEIRHDPCEQKTGHAVFLVRADELANTIYETGEKPDSAE
jgi:hypothetical protein